MDDQPLDQHDPNEPIFNYWHWCLFVCLASAAGVKALGVSDAGAIATVVTIATLMIADGVLRNGQK